MNNRLYPLYEHKQVVYMAVGYDVAKACEFIKYTTEANDMLLIILNGKEMIVPHYQIYDNRLDARIYSMQRGFNVWYNPKNQEEDDFKCGLVTGISMDYDIDYFMNKAYKRLYVEVSGFAIDTRAILMSDFEVRHLPKNTIKKDCKLVHITGAIMDRKLYQPIQCVHVVFSKPEFKINLTLSLS